MYFGFPLADPIIGLIITITIFWIVWDSGKTIFSRLLDGVDPDITEKIHHTGDHVEGLAEITDVKVRWLGHRLHAKVNITVDTSFSVEKMYEIAKEFRHELLHHLKFLSDATIHVDPATVFGPEHHHIDEHSHGGLDSVRKML